MRELDDTRMSGRTSEQMRNAPADAWYVWPNAGSLFYAKVLANYLGRFDLRQPCRGRLVVVHLEKGDVMNDGLGCDAPAPICIQERNSGRTTRQLQAAPSDAWYVCPNAGSLWYYRALAHHLGRLDLRFMSAGRYKTEARYMSPRVRRMTVVIDHACEGVLL